MRIIASELPEGYPDDDEGNGDRNDGANHPLCDDFRVVDDPGKLIAKDRQHQDHPIGDDERTRLTRHCDHPPCARLRQRPRHGL